MKPSGYLFATVGVFIVLTARGGQVQAQTQLSCGDRIEAAISTAGEHDLYRFQGSRGEAIQVVGESIDPALQLQVLVLDPSGELVGSKSIASPRSGPIKLPVGGEYILEVRDYLDEETGRYALSLQFTTGKCAAPIDCGNSRQGPVSMRAEQVAYSFEGSAGEALRITAGLDSSFSQSPVLEVFGPGGNRLGWSPSGDSGSLVLQEDGTQTLILSGFFSFFDIPHPDTYGVSLQFTTGRCAAGLSDGGVIERDVTSLVQQDAIRFSAGAGSWIHLTTASLDYDSWTPRIMLFDQLGTPVDAETGAQADFFIPRDGPYTAIVGTRGVEGRSYRSRLGLPASHRTMVTGNLYPSPVLSSSVALNRPRNEYLAVYAIDIAGFGEYEIYGRRLDAATVQPIGDEFRISWMGPELDPRFQATDPAVAYDPVGNRYLVVWSGEKSMDGKFELYGRFLNGDTGAALGEDDFRITHTGPDANPAFGAYRPRVAYLSASGQFFLVWHADTSQNGVFDVFGQCIAANGVPAGIPVRLNSGSATSTASPSMNPDLAYDWGSGEILVVWQGSSEIGTGSKIEAVLVDTATGAPLPSGKFTVSTSDDENPPAGSAPPAVSCAPSEAACLVVWSAADGRILGRRVDVATSALLGFGSIPMNFGVGGSRPAVSHAGAAGEFLAVWQQDVGDGETEIFGQKIDGGRGLRSGEFQPRLSRVGPDGDSRYGARLPTLLPADQGDRYLVMWSANARPTGGNHLAATSLASHDTKTAGRLNWVMSARETPLGENGPRFSGAVTSAGETGLAIVGGFGALTRMDEDARVRWSVPTDDFISDPVGRPLTTEDEMLIIPGRPGQGEASGLLNAFDGDGMRIWEHGSSEGAWLPLAEGPGPVYYAPSGAGLTALDGDGHALWEFHTGPFRPVTAPVVDSAGRILFGAPDSGAGGRSRIFSLSLAGEPDWTLDVDGPIGNDYAIALGADGTAYVGGSWLAAVSAGGTLKWKIQAGSTPGASCHPVLGSQDQVFCAHGNSIQAFNPSGERIWSFQADEAGEVFSPYVVVDGGGTVYSVSTEKGSSDWTGRLYALDQLGVLSWKAVLANERLEKSVPSLDRAGNLYLVSDQGSLFSFWTGSPAANDGWSIVGGNERHSGQRGITESQRLYFAQFADGAGALSSRLVLLNPNPELESNAHIRLRDDSGRPMTVDLDGAVVDGEVSVQVPPEGLRSLETDSLGALQAGSATVESAERLAGLILFQGTVGLAGVGASAEQLSSFLVPIEVDPLHGLNTGVAMVNLESANVDVTIELLDPDGRILTRSILTGDEGLAASGHLARFADQFNWDSPVDFSGFTGLLKVTATGRLSATAIQTRPGQFATMPVTAWSDRQWGKLLDRGLRTQVGADDAGPYRLQFAQFADGSDGESSLFSEILLFNPDQSSSVQATLHLRDDSGTPIEVDLNGQVVDGALTVTLPPLGLKVLGTDGRGAVVTGSVTVESDGPLSGVIIFGGSVGLAGVGSSRAMTEGFLAPMQTDAAEGIGTGIAFINMEERDTELDLRLLDPNGATIARAHLDGAGALPAGGHRALFVDQLGWDAPVDFERFEGSLKVRSDGSIAATVLQTRPGQFATMPVVPIAAPRQE